jgi:hypothetical protein
VQLARRESVLAQRAAKQFVSQPYLVSIDYIGLTVVGDLLDLTFVEITLDLTTIEALGLSGQAHDPAKLVKTSLPLRTERRKNVAQVNGIIGVPVEVDTSESPDADTPWTIAR